jgi:hypothetical protein
MFMSRSAPGFAVHNTVMTNQMISAAAAAARETSRATDGKFGTQPLAEADLDLDATSGVDQPADGEIVFQQRDGKIFSGEEVLKHAQDAARKYYEMYSVHSKTGTQLADKDDLASESVAAIAKMIRSWEPGKGSGVDDVVAALRYCAANHAVRATAIVWRPVDRAAYIEYDEQLRLTESALQRPTTQREKDALAGQIRDEWHGVRHKLSKEFRQAITVDRSLDRPMTADTDGPTMGDSKIDCGQAARSVTSKGSTGSPVSRRSATAASPLLWKPVAAGHRRSVGGWCQLRCSSSSITISRSRCSASRLSGRLARGRFSATSR